MGHRVHYATYYGLGDPKAKLPNDLDVVFICAHTHLAPLAYALAKVYKMERTRTIIGGPHAKSFARDCLRYFDLVVLECDKSLITNIINDQFDPKSIISSQQPFEDLPSIAERLPEIRTSAFVRGRPYPGSIIPMLASIGCPYSCNFCIDWNTRYQVLSSDRLASDLHYAARHFPGMLLAFYDPNFGVRFDETLTIFESILPEQSSPYIVESSLTNLRPNRLQRLRDTNCVAMTPGIESWSEYSNKAGVGQAINRPKMDQVVEHFQILKEYVPYLGANFIFGLDHDIGDEPFELTKEFVIKTPFVWPTMNTPVPFGGTPLYDTLLNEGRLLKTMPFTFYELPYLVIILKNYDPIAYMQKFVDLYMLASSRKMLGLRFKSMPAWIGKSAHLFRTGLARYRLKIFKDILYRLQTDPQFLAFHTGESGVLPGFYAYEYKHQLGKYAELMPIKESNPILPAAEPFAKLSPHFN
jgi:radical SAM superfamily enzyme YgiQ (UPF0313 family)